MEDEKKTKKQLIEELNELRNCVGELKGFEEEIDQTRVNHEKFAKAFLQNSIPVGITTLKEGRFVDVSDVFLRLMGRKRDEVIGHTSVEIGFITEEQRLTFFNELNKKGHIENLEMKVGTKGGALRDGLFNAVMMSFNNENHLLTVMTDITERKQAEEALRESEATLRALINAPTDSVLLLDSQGVILDINKIAAERLGKDRNELVGNYADNYIPEDTAKKRRSIISKIFETGREVRFEDERDGIWYDTVAYPIPDKDGVVSRVAVIARNITDRKRLDEALKAAEETYRNIFLNAQTGLFRTDMNTGLILDANDCVARFIGYKDRENLLSNPFNIAERYVDPKDRERMISLLKEHGQFTNFETRFRRNDGSIIWIRFSAKIVPDKGWIEGVSEDITKEKEAEEVLRESERRFRELAELLPETVYETDIQGTLTFVNRNAFDRFGYTQEDFAGGLNALDMVTPDDRDRALENIQRIMNGQNIDSNEFTLRRKDGSTFHSMIHSTAIIHDDKSVGLRGFIVDINERKRAEEALRDTQQMLCNILDNFPGVVFWKDRNSVYQGCNRAFAKAAGINETHEITGKTDHDMPWAQSEAEEYRNMDRAVMESGVPRLLIIESQHEADGRVGWYETSKVPLFDETGKVVGVLGVSGDITERKRAEDNLRESETKYRSLVDNSYDLIWTLSADGVFTYVSPSWQRTLGYEPSYMIGKAFHPFVHPDDVSICEEYLHKVIQARERMPGPEYRVKHVGGTWRWHTASGTPVFSSEGSFISFVGISRDITDRKQAETERKLLQERLQRAEKMEALGTLAGGVAHDLNNVLGIVVGYSELLINSVDESSPIRGRLMNIMKGGERAASIVQDLLTLARRGVPSRDVLNLNKIIADCQQSLEFERLSSYHPSVKIKTDIDSDLLNISGSSVHLGKTLFNLVSNASESMTKGGIVTIRTANQYLDKPIQGYDEVREGDYVVLSVSDTGEGIPASDLKRIFEPFYTKKVMGKSGTGLGLAVVWGTVKDHHGYINVESEEGKGSAFTLYFPVTREDISVECIAISISEYMGNGESILVVDDVKGQRDLAAEMLQTLNYNVATVSSGEEAIEHLKEHQVDLMVLDMIMDPGMDGLDTFRSILEINPKQKAIVVSGFSETDRVKAAQSLGVGAYIRKPYVSEKLGLAVRKELDRK